ncbi:MAG: GNAT family N-acetyltransferase [Phycisphaerales bacterium]|jgi:RimJ/RimL family protein N-acetyltransferase|nr:GNAT family N-acetyltransferase [Phycisphaerales bacterium]
MHKNTSVRIRDVESSDLPIFYDYQADPVSVEMAVVYPRDQQAFDRHWESVRHDSTVVVKTILLNDQVVGYISCFKMDDLDSVGYWIDRDYWGLGIATQALKLMLDIVSTRPLHARVARQNEGSIRVLQKCDFKVIEYQLSPDDGKFPVCEEAIMTLH